MSEGDLEKDFWKALKQDRTVMLGLAGIEDGHSQPMSAQLLEEHEQRGGPIWFFTVKDIDLVQALGTGHRAKLHFSSKGHELFATVHGELLPSSDRVTIDRLWNPSVAEWFEGGPDDVNLQLLRFNPNRVQVWLGSKLSAA